MRQILAPYRVPRSTPAPEPSSRHLYAGHHLASQQAPARPIPEQERDPGFDVSQRHYDTSTVVHSRSPSRLPPDASRAPFPQRSPPRLIHRSSLRRFETFPCRTIPGGPTSITGAAPQPSARSSTSHPRAVLVAHRSRCPWHPVQNPARPIQGPAGRSRTRACKPP
jgi:hypothetical protein